MHLPNLAEDDILIDGATQAHLLQHPQTQVSAANSLYLPSSQLVLLRDSQANDLAVYRTRSSTSFEERPLSELSRLDQWERAEQYRVPTAQVISGYALRLLARMEIAGVCEAVKDISVNYGLDDTPDRAGLLIDDEDKSSQELGLALIKFIELSAKSAGALTQECRGRFAHRDPQFVPRALQPGDPREGLRRAMDEDEQEGQ